MRDSPAPGPSPNPETTSARRMPSLALGAAGVALVVAGLLLARVENSIPAVGVVYAEGERYTYAPAAASLDRIHVAIGQEVRNGDPLFTLIDPDLPIAVAAAEMDLIRIRDEIDAAGFELRELEVKPLPPEVAVARHHMESLMDKARERLAALRQKHDRLTVRATIDGAVVDIYSRHEGMRVTEGEPLAKLVPPNPNLKVRVDAPQRNIDLVRVGSSVRMESRVFRSVLEGYTWGRVSRIADDSKPPADGATVAEPTYEIIVEVTDSPHPLKLGSKLDVKLIVGRQNLFESMFNISPERKGLQP